MKKLLNKIANNKFLLTISLAILVFLFMLLTNGFGGIIPGWHGIVNIISKFVINCIQYTANGSSALGEAIWFACVIPVILLFGNKYIFTQKKMNYFKSLSLVWIDLFMCLGFLSLSLFSVGFKNIDGAEFVSMLILYLFVGLFEELLCRGWILNEFLERFGNDRKNVIFSIFASATIFGLIHIVNFFGGQELFSTIIQIINAINGGIVFAALYYRTKNIWASVTLHTIWDFTLSLSSVNSSITCASIEVTETTIGSAIASSIMVLFIIIPEVYNWLLLLNKKDINDTLPEEHRVQLTEKELKNNKTFKIVISVLAIIYLIGFIAIFSIVGIVTGLNKDTCSAYPKTEVSNYSEDISHLTDVTIGYDIESYDTEYVTNCGSGSIATNCIPTTTNEHLEFNFKINDNQELEITNTKNNYTEIANVTDVYKIYPITTEYGYEIYILASNEDGDGVVYSLAIHTDKTLNDKSTVSEFAKGFKHLELPPIVKIGALETADSTYPLFIAQNNNDYFIKGEQIYIFEK